MSFTENNRNNGLDLLEKRNKGIISRMKRSLSATSRPQLPIKLASSTHTTTNENTLFQRSQSPLQNNLSSPTPTSSRSFQSVSVINPSPTIHLNYETFSSGSASNLSIKSFPSSKRVSNHESISSIGKRMNASSRLSLSKSHEKTKFESRVIENDSVSLTKLVDSNTAASKEDEERRYAPSPAMYWSRPKTFGIKPPSLRAHASAVYEDKMYVFGGTTESSCSDTLYVFELDTYIWSIPRVYGTIPHACRAHSFLVNPKNGKLYLFGGGDKQKYYNHLYVLDTNTMIWSRPKTTGQKPSERRAHVAVIWQNYLYVFGGGDGTKALNDLYRLDLKTKEWSAVVTQGAQPGCRGYHTGNLVGNKLVIYGGSDGKECFGGGVHILDLESNTWFSAALDEQVPRLSHSSLGIGSYLFVIAGHDGTQYCNELLMLNLVNMSWETKAVYGQAPTPRGYHTTVLYDSRIYLFGGYNGTTFSNDIYILDLSSYAYLPQIVNFTIDTA